MRWKIIFWKLLLHQTNVARLWSQKYDQSSNFKRAQYFGTNQWGKTFIKIAKNNFENCISNFSPFAFTKQLFSEPVIFHQRNFPDRNASMFVLQILVHKLSQEPMCGDVFSDFHLSGIVLSKMWSQVSARQTQRSINICTRLTNTWRGRTAGYSQNRKLDF